MADKVEGFIDLECLRRIHYGPGKVAAVGSELESNGWSRAIVVTGRTLANSDLLTQITDAAGGRVVHVFDGATQHVHADGVRALVTEIQRHEADAVISFGGGSAIDTAKAALASVLTGRDLTRETSQAFYEAKAFEATGKLLGHIAVPTTLSASEYNTASAVSTEDGSKRALIGYPVGAVAIINDPRLTLETPDLLWASSGVKALDHAVEALYSSFADSFTDACASNAVRMLQQHLPLSLSTSGETQIEHRGLVQTGTGLSNLVAVNTRYGLSHAMGHKIGYKWNIAHGITSTVCLPHAARFMADVAPERFVQIADAFGVPQSKDDSTRANLAVDALAEFISALNVPVRLRDLDLGIEKSDLEEIVPVLQDQVNQQGSVGRDLTALEVFDLLRATL
ncbi:MAG: hypothetical protein C0482_22175 [Gordonia sp.]|nr:hypothetical protein [Gordonia sp. (in: high G+C Gram-positive bacteria)]